MVLVTHQLQHLQEATQVLMMEKGKVSKCGSFQELLTQGVDFSSVLAYREERGMDEGELKDHNKDTIDSVSHSAITEKTKKTHDHLQTGPEKKKEMRSSGSVSAQHYAEYLKGGSSWMGVLTVAAIAVTVFDYLYF